MTISTLVPCEWCGATHQTKCPLVKAIEYHEDGRVKRVEFMTVADYTTPAAPCSVPYPIIGSPSPLWPSPMAPTVTWGNQAVNIVDAH